MLFIRVVGETNLVVLVVVGDEICDDGVGFPNDKVIALMVDQDWDPSVGVECHKRRGLVLSSRKIDGNSTCGRKR